MRSSRERAHRSRSGFISSPNATTADGVRAMGTLQTIGTGVSAAFPAANPQDKLIDLIQSLRQPYRQGAVFVMNSNTASLIRKFKTTDGAFIWQPGLVSGTPATLLGYPVIEAEDMPDVAANSLSVAFGNFKAGYVIAERSVDDDPARSVHAQAVRPFLRDQAGRRAGDELRSDQVAEVRLTPRRGLVGVGQSAPKFHQI